MLHRRDHKAYKQGSKGARRFSEQKFHQHLAFLSKGDLRAGDILIAKEWTPHNMESFFIPLGQMVFSHSKGASSASEHVLLVLDDGVDKTAESVSNGVLLGKGINKRDHVVYGCTDEDLRWEAVHVAERLGGVTAGKTNQLIHKSGKSPVQFRSSTGAASVVFRRKSKGKRARKRLDQIYDYVYNQKPLGNVRMVCSEFVTTCYEVAARALTEASSDGTVTTAFDVDPRAISAKALEGLLRNANGPFKLSGRYKGTRPYTSKQLEEVQRAREALRVGVTQHDENYVPEAVRRARARQQQQG